MSPEVVFYRGSLKSCNYQCSYCPFSKHRTSQREQERDRREWFRFVNRLVKGKGPGNVRALMVAPYGEALIHPWYWEGLAAVSQAENMEAIGAQTNLSFLLEKSLEYYEKSKGKVEKLRLWGTFHPEMTRPEEFARKCRQVWDAGIALSVGAVGVPGNLEQIRRLRSLLPEEIYLWVNKMDGLKREYTEAEKEAFLELDPYFWQELTPVPADVEQCRGRLFVESDGRMRICNIGRVMEGNWYEEGGAHGPEEEERENRGQNVRGMPLRCGRKWCSCYLAYGGRADYINQILFGPYPVFRIPRRPKAVFLDIMGTLLPKEALGEGKGLENSRVPLRTKLALETLRREGTLLFQATTLPEKDAREICQEIGTFFSGGVFAGGAHVYAEWENGRQEYFHRLECGSLSGIEALKKELGFRMLSYRNGEMLYKLTLVRPGRRPWNCEEQQRLEEALDLRYRGRVRWVREDFCLQLVAREATKANGVRMICGWLGIPLSETGAAGDSPEDEEMTGLWKQ